MENFVIEGPNGPIAGSRIGHGPCLVLIAGLGAGRSLWGELPALLADQFTVITLDNRGIGGSRGGAPFTIDRAAEDQSRRSDRAPGGTDQSGTDRPHGRRIERRPDDDARPPVDRTAAHTARVSAARGVRSGVDEPGLRPAVSPAFLAFAPPFHRRLPGFVDQAGLLYGLDPADRPGALAQADAMLEGWDDREKLTKLDFPALILAGERDPVVAWEDTAEIAESLPRARFVKVPDAGHSVLAEGGKEVFDSVVAFLRGD